MISRITTLSLLLILCLSFVNLSSAQPVKTEEHSCPNCPEKKAMMENPGMMVGSEMMMEKQGMMMGKPEFSPEQEKEIHKLKMKLHKEIAPLRTDFETKEMELQELWMDEKLDIEKIVKKVNEINKIQWQIQEKEIRHQFEIFKILKPEQQKMFRNRHRMGMGPKGRFEPRMCPMGMGGCCQ